MNNKNLGPWGNISCALDASVEVCAGLLKVSLTRTQHDWTTCFSYHQDKFWREADGWKNEWRTATMQTSGELDVTPALPNRNIVARPVKDLYIPAGAEVTLYVGYPAWLQIKAEDNLTLVDLATELMSETWLGPNTMVGHVAYATQTQARLSFDNLPANQALIRTPITIRNESSSEVNISRLSIPAPQLALYQQGGLLWSCGVEVTCEEVFSQASIKVQGEPPAHLDMPKRIAEPRVVEELDSVTRAIGFLFS